MKQNIKSKLTLGILTLASALAMYVPFAPAASANPISYVAAAGDSCMLPDGSQGQKQADGRTCCPQSTDSDTSCLYKKYINPAIELMAALIGIIVTISIMIGGIQYITSEGDPQKAMAGRQRILSSLVALAAFILLYAFLQFIIPGGVLNG